MSDQYYSVHRVMAVEIPNTKERAGRRAFSPTEVDAMDLAQIAVLLGVDANGNVTNGEADDPRAKMQELARRRAKGEQVNWTDL